MHHCLGLRHEVLCAHMGKMGQEGLFLVLTATQLSGWYILVGMCVKVEMRYLIFLR